MAELLDNCLFTAGSMGTADFADGAADPTCRNLEDAGAEDGKVYPYKARNATGTEWEIGRGTVVVSGGTWTLERTTIQDSSDSGNKINFGTHPKILITAGKVEIGDVNGPASATDGAIAVFDGTTGKLIKDGGSTIANLALADGSNITGRLGGNALDISGGDWNTADQTGFYTHGGGNPAANAPVPSTAFYGLTIRQNANFIMQLAWERDSAAPRQYIRIKGGVNWGAWQPLPRRFATQGEAEAGTEQTVAMSPLSTAQAISAATAGMLVTADIGTTVQPYDADTLKGDIENQSITGGANVTPKDLGTIDSGTVTIDVGDCPMQTYLNDGAHTLESTGTGSTVLRITNGSSAGAITLTAFGSRVYGDSFDTTNGSVFRCVVEDWTGSDPELFIQKLA